MEETTKLFYEGKQKQIADLGKAIIEGQPNVQEVRFELYEHKIEGWREEFIIVTYKGGAFTSLSTNGNSFSANYTAIGRVLNSGNYDHSHYEKIKKAYRRIL